MVASLTLAPKPSANLQTFAAEDALAAAGAFRTANGVQANAIRSRVE